MGFFQLPLDLPHACTIAERISMLLHRNLDGEAVDSDKVIELSGELFDLLWPYRMSGENPVEPEATEVQQEAARIGREIVDQIEALHLGTDRLGQCIRNLFECLSLGQEGAEISLRAGEDPNSIQRPT